MFNPSLIPIVGKGRSVTGEIGSQDADQLLKAIEMGYGSDVAALTGGGALRIQSLDKTLMSTIQENKHFALFNTLAQGSATTTVDEWSEHSSIGGFLGGSTNTETGTIAATQGEYARRVGLVKYLMTRREISFVSTQSNNIVAAEAVEAQGGTLQLLTDAEFLCFEGDDDVVPTEFPGIFCQMEDLGSADHIIDAEGDSVISVALVDKACATIAGAGNFGMATHIFSSMLVQSDLNQFMDPAYRVSIDGSQRSLQLGAPVKGISTSWGDIKVVNDVFIRDERQQKPFECDHAAIAVANNAMKPTAAFTSGAGGASSKFASKHAGNYYYRITGLNANGQSESIVSSVQAIPAGGQCSIVITDSSGSTETGYAIYRSRLNGTGDADDTRLMCRVAKAGGTTTWVDNNRYIPGTAKAFILTMNNNAINWRKYLPLTKFSLYPTVSAVIPFALLLFGYLRISKRRQHVVIKNICTFAQDWKPFG